MKTNAVVCLVALMSLMSTSYAGQAVSPSEAMDEVVGWAEAYIQSGKVLLNGKPMKLADIEAAKIIYSVAFRHFDVEFELKGVRDMVQNWPPCPESSQPWSPSAKFSLMFDRDGKPCGHSLVYAPSDLEITYRVTFTDESQESRQWKEGAILRHKEDRKLK